MAHLLENCLSRVIFECENVCTIQAPYHHHVVSAVHRLIHVLLKESRIPKTQVQPIQLITKLYFLTKDAKWMLLDNNPGG